jgi:hypothetical protein
MKTGKRPPAFRVIVAFLGVSLVFILAGQTTAVLDYDLSVKLGLNEPADLVGKYGVEVNRAFGASDTIIYIPLIIVSLVGLFLKKPWSLMTTGAVMGISAYWATTVAFMFLFLRDVADYRLVPGLGYWLCVGAYIVFGVWGILYLVFNGKKLIE